MVYQRNFFSFQFFGSAGRGRMRDQMVQCDVFKVSSEEGRINYCALLFGFPLKSMAIGKGLWKATIARFLFH